MTHLTLIRSNPERRPRRGPGLIAVGTVLAVGTATAILVGPVDESTRRAAPRADRPPAIAQHGAAVEWEVPVIHVYDAIRPVESNATPPPIPPSELWPAQ